MCTPTLPAPLLLNLNEEGHQLISNRHMATWSAARVGSRRACSTGTRSEARVWATQIRHARESQRERLLQVPPELQGSAQWNDRRLTRPEPAEPAELVIAAKRSGNFPVFVRNNAMTPQQLSSVKEQITAGGGDFDCLETSIPTCALLKLTRQARDDLPCFFIDEPSTKQGAVLAVKAREYDGELDRYIYIFT